VLIGQRGIVLDQALVQRDGPVRLRVHLVGVGGQESGAAMGRVLPQQLLAAFGRRGELLLGDQLL
jgi:hypothetical protein